MSRPLRLVHVVPSYYPALRYGGPIVSVHGLCKALAACGHRVDVYTTNRDGDGTLAEPLATRVDLDGVGVHYFDVPCARRLYFSPALDRALAASVPAADLVHLHSVFLHPTLAAARRAHAARVPYVLSPRGMLVDTLVRGRSRLAKTTWIKLFERKTIAGASAIHATSALEAAELEAFGLPLPAVRVVPNGVDAAPAGRRHGREPGLILFLGRIEWKKGLDRLVVALRELPAARALIAGNDEDGYGERLQRLARSCGVADRIAFPGPVYGDAKQQLYGRASVFVLPSYSENFGNAVLEAMAAGCPVVISRDVGLAQEVEASEAGLVHDGDAGALARAIGDVLGAPARAAAMGERGAALARERYSWPVVAQAMVALYRDVLGAARGAGVA